MVKKRVLFLCTGNSARSQMAEAIVNARWGERWEAVSAGTRPVGFVHPMALKVLEEAAIPTADLRSKTPDEFREEDLDLVVTVCNSAAEDCPLWLGSGCRVHLGFPDPALAEGSTGEVREVFRQVRDDIARRVEELLSAHQG